MTKQYVTKDSGKRQNYKSGMRRDLQEGKPRFDLIYQPVLKRWAELMSRGAEKYGENNWLLANSFEELRRFKASAWRHFFAWYNGIDDNEDHMTGVLFNIAAIEYLKEKLGTDINERIWKTIPSIPEYEASSHGEIRKKKNGHIMAQWNNCHGYKMISLSYGKHRNYSVHRLVAEAFIGPLSLCINHIDLDKTNNNITNIEYVSYSENEMHSRFLKPKKISGKILNLKLAEEIRLRIEKGEKQKDLAKEYNVSPQTICDIGKHRIWKGELQHIR